MDIGISYQKAEEILDAYIKDPVIKMHCRESEAIMRAIARHFGEDEEMWGTIGLIHDIDWELTKENPQNHGIKAVEILKNAGGTDFLIETIQSHIYPYQDQTDYHGCPVFIGKLRQGNLEHALAAAETSTGLIIATALIQPEKKLVNVKVESLKKKFKSKAFAANCRREIISECEKIGMSVDDFLALGLKALQGIHDQLGL